MGLAGQADDVWMVGFKFPSLSGHIVQPDANSLAAKIVPNPSTFSEGDRPLEMFPLCFPGG